MRYLKDLLLDKKFRFSFIVMLSLTFLVILSLFSPYEPTQWQVVPEELPPSFKHPFGTTSLGQDLFWTICSAVKNSLVFAIITAAISRAIAVTLGMLSGFKKGAFDKVLMAISDALISLPRIPILILIGAIFKESLRLSTLAIILASIGWAWDARVIRSQVLSLRERDFTYTALLSGSKALSIVFKEFFPHITPIIFASILNNMMWAIGIETTLSVLGLTNLLVPTLGTTLYWAISYQALFLGYWWWIVFPVLIIVFLFVSIYLLSISISEYLDPRMRIQSIGQA